MTEDARLAARQVLAEAAHAEYVAERAEAAFEGAKVHAAELRDRHKRENSAAQSQVGEARKALTIARKDLDRARRAASGIPPELGGPPPEVTRAAAGVAGAHAAAHDA